MHHKPLLDICRIVCECRALHCKYVLNIYFVISIFISKKRHCEIRNAFFDVFANLFTNLFDNLFDNLIKYWCVNTQNFVQFW